MNCPAHKVYDIKALPTEIAAVTYVILLQRKMLCMSDMTGQPAAKGKVE